MGNGLKFITSILICFAAGALGTIFTLSAIPSWYSYLNKPFFSPPNYLFGPVWSILYFLMGVSLYLVWKKGVRNKKIVYAIKAFAVQLILNAVWSPTFFGLRNIFLALIIIIAMWAAILKTILVFGKINKMASYLLYPYIAWVSFATILNFSVWVLNR